MSTSPSDLPPDLSGSRSQPKEHGLNGETAPQDIYNFTKNSASELLKTIIIASQANQGTATEQANAKTTVPEFAKDTSSTTNLLNKIISSQSVPLTQPGTKLATEDMAGQGYTLPTDLQNFSGEPFGSHFSNSQSVNNQHQHQQQQQQNFAGQGDGNMLNFNGMDTNLSQLQETSNHIPRTVNESSRATEDSMIRKHSESFNLQTFETFSNQSQTLGKAQVIQQLLSTPGIEQQQHSSTYPVSSPEYPKGSPVSSSSSPYTDSNLSPFHDTTNSTFMEMDTQHSQYQEMKYPDTSTQSTLITGTDRLRLDSFNAESVLDNDVKPKVEWIDNEFENKSGKVARMHQDSDASSALSPSVDRVFNPDGAQQEVPKEFTFTVFGQKPDESLELLPFGQENIEAVTSEETAALPSVVDSSPFKTPTSIASNQVKKHRENIRRQKEPILCQTFPSRLHGYELRILEQPEEQHRARYLTEGSRGAVKSRSGTGYPVVKLFGYKGEATLQVFIGNDSGKVRPHGFYQACKVCGKNSTSCSEKDIDGTTVIEITLQPSNDMTASIDCAGILKLRNADVEQRIGIAKAKKKSTKARMIFRVTFQKPCGSPQVLQVPSCTILCTQPIGQPEICKMSLKKCHVNGGEELFIIGKNFLRGTRVFFQLYNDDTQHVTWEKEGEIDRDYFQTTHLIAVVPQFDGDQQSIQSNLEFQVVIHSGGKISDPVPFMYTFEDLCMVQVKQDMDMGAPETSAAAAAAATTTTLSSEETGRKRNYPFVAPEALELNQQIQQTQQQASSSNNNNNNSDLFQLPPGIITGVLNPEQEIDSFTPMEASTTPSGTGNCSNSQSVLQESFPTELEEGALRKNSFSASQSNIGQENLDLVQTPTLDSKNENMLTENATNLRVNEVTFTTASDVFSDHHIDFNQIKTLDQFPTNTFGIPSCNNAEEPTTPNIVSQFLQNLALKTSDPMLCGTRSVMSMSGLHQNNTIMTPANNLVMTPDTQKTKPANSLLKEVLTCPTSSLDNFGAFNLQNSATDSIAYTTKTETTAMDMDIPMDSIKSLLQQTVTKQETQNATINFNTTLKESSSMEFSTNIHPQVSDTIDLTGESTMALPNQPAPDFSPDQTVPNEESEMPFSPSHVLTNFNIEQPMSEIKPVMTVVSQYTEQPIQTAAVNTMGMVHHNPVTTFTQQSPQLTTPLLNTTLAAGFQLQNPELTSAQQSPQLTTPLLNTTLAAEFQLQNPELTSAQQSPQLATPLLNTTLAAGFQLQNPELTSAPVVQAAVQEVNNLFSGGSSIQVNPASSLLPQFLQQIATQGLSPAQQQTIQQHLQQQQQQQRLQQQLQQQQQLVSPNPQLVSPNQQLVSPNLQEVQPDQQQLVSPNSQMVPQNPQMVSQNTQMVSQSPQMVSQSLQEVQTDLQQLQQQPQLLQEQQQQYHLQQPSQQQQQQQLAGVIPDVLTQDLASNSQPVPVGSQASPGQSTSLVSTAANTSVAPQIIICNNPTAPGSLPTQVAQNQYAAPSIVIVPGQGGANNQIENLLRSILGSMMPPAQQQQQQPPQ